jgi:hypothetical protein
MYNKKNISNFDYLIAWMAAIGIISIVFLVAYAIHLAATHVEIRWVESTPISPDHGSGIGHRSTGRNEKPPTGP